MLSAVMATVLAAALAFSSALQYPVSPAEDRTLEQTALTETAEQQNVGERVLRAARDELGYVSDQEDVFTDENGLQKPRTKYGDWFGAPYSLWCDMFVSYCVREAGLDDYPIEYSCLRHELLLKQAGYWRDWNAYIPSPGDLVFFTGTGRDDMCATHVGIVEEVIPPDGDAPGYLITIEGNVQSPSCVARLSRSFDRVLGYGTYTVGVIDEAPVNSYRNPYTYRFNRTASEPIWGVLQFIGADSSLYASVHFPDLVRLPILYPPYSVEEPDASVPDEPTAEAPEQEEAMIGEPEQEEATREEPEEPSSNTAEDPAAQDLLP